MRCPPGDTPIKILSGGEQRRVALCRLLSKSRTSCLLDEPTNHLDAESVAWLEQHLQKYAGTVIAVTHDRYFLDNVAGWILELDRGEGIPWKGNYSSWLEQKQERLRREEKSESERQKTLQRELEWIRMSPKGRQAKGKARINSYEALLSQESRNAPPGSGDLHSAGAASRAKVVIEAEGVTKAYGDNLLVEDMTFKLPPGGIVGIIGPNGAGKTTLFRMITGQEQPDCGSYQHWRDGQAGLRGSEPRDASMPTRRSGRRSPAGRMWSSSARARSIRAPTSRASISPAQTSRRRSAIFPAASATASIWRGCSKQGANVLLLDEPTNDLDVNTMRALEEALENFAGCAVVISHDRWFLDRIATHILAFEGDSRVVWFEGNYSDYEADRKARLGAAADQPHRIKYRHLTRG